MFIFTKKGIQKLWICGEFPDQIKIHLSCGQKYVYDLTQISETCCECALFEFEILGCSLKRGYVNYELCKDSIKIAEGICWIS